MRRDQRAIELRPTFALRSHKQPVTAVLFLMNGWLASCSGDRTIRLWDTETGELVHELRGHRKEVTCLALLLSGLLVSGSIDKSIMIWDPIRMTCVKRLLGHKSVVMSFQVLANGHLASCSIDGAIMIWDPSAETCLVSTFVDRVTKPIFSPLGLLSKGQLVSCSFELDAGVIKIWNTAQGTIDKRINTHLAKVTRLLVLPKSNHVVIGSYSGMIKIFDVDAAKLVRNLRVDGSENSVWSLILLPNDCILASYSDLTMRLWDPKSKKVVQTIPTGHVESVTSISISPDGKTVATGSIDRSIQVWSLSLVSPPSTAAVSYFLLTLLAFIYVWILI